MRALARWLLVGIGVAGLLASSSPAAMAKGDAGELVSGSAVVTGPGLAQPLVVRGAKLERMLTWIGPIAPPILEPRCCAHFLSPRPSHLGPRYEVRYELRFRTHPGYTAGPVTVLTFHQDLYPYAPNAILHQPVPWAFTPAGQTLALGRRTADVQSDWIDSSLLFDLLVAKGLPRAAPAGAVAAGPAKPAGGPVTAMGIAALGIVLLAGALGVRRRGR